MTMLPTLEKPHSLISGYDTVRAMLESTGPDRLQDMRDRAYNRFRLTGLPTSKDEEFRFTPLKGVEETDFAPAYGATVAAEDIAKFRAARMVGPRIAFVNGEYAPELSDLRGLAREATVCSLQQALEIQPDNVLQHLGTIANLEGKLGSTNDERFTWLNTAYLSDGAYIVIPKDVVLDLPIQLLFVNRADHGAFACHPRVLVIAGANSKSVIVETHLGVETTSPYLSNGVTEVYAAEGANVEHVRIQQEAGNSFHIGTIAAHQERDSIFHSTVATFGASVSRLDINLWLNGENTETRLNGAYVGRGSQILDHHTRIDHAKPNCNSFEVYKGILDDKAAGIFNGKIFVYEDAQKTDAKQTNQALLLSKTASIDTKPQLEIFADDVKCTHGATIGQLRDDALFYLRSRGIPEMEARNLLVYAFAAEVIEKISVEELREVLEAELFAKLGVPGD